MHIACKMGVVMSQRNASEPKNSVHKKIEPRTECTVFSSQLFISCKSLIYIAYYARNYITRAFCFYSLFKTLGSRFTRFTLKNAPRLEALA